MEVKLFDSELKVMDVLWRADRDLTAGQIAKILLDEIGSEHNVYRDQKVHCKRCN